MILQAAVSITMLFYINMKISGLSNCLGSLINSGQTNQNDHVIELHLFASNIASIIVAVVTAAATTALLATMHRARTSTNSGSSSIPNMTKSIQIPLPRPTTHTNTLTHSPHIHRWHHWAHRMTRQFQSYPL